ncbi:MAG: hypothetical protein OXC66_05850 [Roseovarius sp.]|nr:hypothetical protein [Roseovarius sp.]
MKLRAEYRQGLERLNRAARARDAIGKKKRELARDMDINAEL